MKLLLGFLLALTLCSTSVQADCGTACGGPCTANGDCPCMYSPGSPTFCVVFYGRCYNILNCVPSDFEKAPEAVNSYVMGMYMEANGIKSADSIPRSLRFHLNLLHKPVPEMNDWEKYCLARANGYIPDQIVLDRIASGKY